MDKHSPIRAPASPAASPPHSRPRSRRGTIYVAVLGVAMLVLIATGIVIHRKILAELFTQRWGRSFRVVMSDLHKSAGIWGLGFHILIAATGAWMGLAPLFEQSYKYLATDTPAAAAPKPARRANAAAPSPA